MAVQFEQIFTAHPVGQGLFYTGIIRYKGARGSEGIFRMVFDCGSFNYKNCAEEVSLFIENNLSDNAPIDLLVISHFDQDHINFLKPLLKDRKVKHLVAPFINYEERITLSLNYLNDIDGVDNDPNNPGFTLDCIIDPLAALSDSLDENSQVTFITGGDNNSFERENQDENNENKNNDGIYDIEFGFEEPLADFVTNALTTIPNGVSVKSTTDSNKGVAKFRVSGTAIMDFLFYRINLGNKKEEYFKEVYHAFVIEYHKELKDNPNPDFKAVLDVIKNIKSGKRISEIFKAAEKKVEVSEKPRRGLGNINSTALSMLHRNRVSFYNFILKASSPNHYLPYSHSFEPFIIHKYDGTNGTRNEQYLTRGFHDHDYFHHRFYRHHDPEFIPLKNDTNFVLPNTLLTSDSFLLTATEVNNLYAKYKEYWDDFWLLQIPHHGSKDNSDKTLFNRIPTNICKFMNYGVEKTWKMAWRHPSPELINDLTATGAAKKLFPVTEFMGLRFHYAIHTH
jgi:hypothetical protein